MSPTPAPTTLTCKVCKAAIYPLTSGKLHRTCGCSEDTPIIAHLSANIEIKLGDLSNM